MPYVLVENFSGGVDDRKSPITSPPGTLLYANNVHLTAGGEIEKRKAFAPLWPQEPGNRAIGLGGGLGGKLYLYGNGPRPATLYSDFEWVNVQRPGNLAVRVRRSQWWTDQPYSLIEYENGERRVWLGATEIDLTTKWALDIDPYKLNDIITFLSKVYGVQETFLSFSGLATPDEWGTPAATGSGYIDGSQEGPQFFDLTAAALYQNRILAFSRKGLLVYGVDPDPDLNQLLQSISNFGCIAPKSIVNLGELDVLFLSYSGVRSVRARDSSNIATVADAGAPINRTLVNHLQLLLQADGEVPAVATYEPNDGRYLLALGDVIYAFSYFPSSRVSAWTTYTPGFDVLDMVSIDSNTFVLGDDFLYSYGRYSIRDQNIGFLSPSDYDLSPVEVVMPYIDAEAPATAKQWSGLDAGVEGVWSIDANFNLRAQEHYERLASFTGTSYDRPASTMDARSTHCKLRFTHQSAGYAALRNVTLHYRGKEAA